MSLSKTTKQKLDSLISRGVSPGALKSEAIAFREGKSTIRLVAQDGKPTPAGLYYAERTGQPLPRGGFLQQTPQRSGNIESITLRDGKKAVVRRWDGGLGEYVFTSLGRRFYGTLRRNYVVSVPIVVRGLRRNGTTYTARSHMPVEKLGLKPTQLPLNLTLAERRERVKALVKKELPKGALAEISDETWELDEEGSWQIHEETVGTNPETKQGEAHVVLDRRMRGPATLPGQLLFPESLCSEAFNMAEDGLCAPRQMAKILRMDLGLICSELEEISRRLYGEVLPGTSPRMILEFCRQRKLGCCVVHNEQVIQTEPGNPILAFAVHGEHCWFYEGRGARRALHQRTPAEEPRQRLRKPPRESQFPEYREWLPWSGEVLPGHYHCSEEELPEVRAWFLRKGRSPHVLLRDEAHFRCLIYHCVQPLDGVLGACHVHAVPEDAEALSLWAERLGVPYRGEGLPSLALKVFQKLVREQRQRVILSGPEKSALLLACDSCCAACGSRTPELEFDHVQRFSEGFCEQSFQPLCKACHDEKTALESRCHDGDALASFFEKNVWERYVRSPRCPPLVYKARKDAAARLSELEIADVIRCRRSALYHNPHPLPMFSVLDDIQPRVEPRLGDLCFLSKPYKSFVTQLGYTGPGWVHRCQAEFLLHHGVVSWDDITHVLSASSHYPAGLLAEPLQRMEDAWQGDEVRAKFSVNSLIGLWCLDEPSVLRHRSSPRRDDEPRECGLQSEFPYIDSQGQPALLHDFVTKTPLVTNASLRPLHDLALCTEAVRVGQMLYCLKMARALPYEFKTDSVLYRPLKRSPVGLSELTLRSLDGLRSRHQLFPANHMTGIASSERPFRVAKAQSRDLMLSEPGLPRRSEPPVPLVERPWRTLPSHELAEERVLSGGSLFVQGVAGTGKSRCCLDMVERLRAAGKRVEAISKTHVASHRVQGVTADHWVRRHVANGSACCDVLFVDEVSQLDVGLLTQLAKLTMSGMQFLLAGDFNQFPPIGDGWRGSPVPEGAFQRSGLLHTMSGGATLVLTECRRSERELFDYYASLILGGSRFETPLCETLKEARERFSFSGPCLHNLCISHRRRMDINRRLNALLAPACSTKLSVVGREAARNGPQTMLLHPGLQLLGSVRVEKRGIKNNVLYTVEAVGDGVKLRELEASFSFDEVKEWLRLSFAQTYASCQGTEFEGPLRLHQTAHPFFTKRHLFVGLSRARSAAEVSVVA